MCRLTVALTVFGLAGSVFPASAASILFTAGGAGTVAITVGSSVTSLSASNDSITAASSTSTALAFANSAATFSSTGPATFTGEIDFSDAAGKSTGGTCAADAGGVCKVDSSSSLGNTTVTGLTQQDTSVITGATTEWNDLINSSTGWGSVAGTTVDLDNGGKLCVGTGLTGCLATAATTTTLVINGVSQTAYVFNVTTTGSSGHIGGAVSINGNSTGALVILNYVGSQNAGDALQTNQAFTLLGGLTDDQVLLNIEGGGLQSSGGFVFNGAVAVQGATADLDNATINGRLYIDTSATASIQSGFDLTAPANAPAGTPEPGTVFLMGFALIGLGLMAKKHTKSKPSATKAS